MVSKVVLFVVLVVAISGTLAMVETEKEKCQMRKFKDLFQRAKQEFVYKCLRWTEKKPDGACSKSNCLNMDSHGDGVLAVWKLVTDCKDAPCRSPNLPKVATGITQMTGILNNFLACSKSSEDDAFVKKAKVMVNEAIKNNDEALKC